MHVVETADPLAIAAAGYPSRAPVVVHVLSSFDPGGQERVAVTLAAAQIDDGLDVRAVSLGSRRQTPIAEAFSRAGAGVHYVPKRPGLDLLLSWRLARLFRAQRATVVHTHNPLPLIYAAPAAKIAGAAVVHTKHGQNPLGRGARWLARLAARLVDAYVAVSDETAARALEAREVAEAKLSVIPNGIDLSRFRRDPGARKRVRAELGIPPEAFVIGTVGRIDENKNHFLLLEAAAPLLNDDIHLVVAGDGPRRKALERATAELEARRSIHFTGWREDVPALLSAFDVFALSSASEGLPLAVPEAMAAELPVVATSVGGLPSVVEQGETGYLVPPGDPGALRARLAGFATNRERALSLGRRGRQRALVAYAAERMSRDYLAVYRRVAGNSGNNGRIS